MRATIIPGVAKGEVLAPPSKSMAHRLLISAGLASGTSRIHHVAMSQDILATLDCLAALGASYETEGETVIITGADPTSRGKVDLPCRECGSTLRFMIPLCLLSQEDAVLTGSSRLMERPLTVYEDLCKKQGLSYALENANLHVSGCLTAGEYVIPGNISSQFVSGLLFALPFLSGDSRIRLIPPVESRPYIDMTLLALGAFGIEAAWDGETDIFVKGNQSYTAREATVEGDYSNAAFLEALNLCGGEVKVGGLAEDSLQGDQIYLQYYKKLQEGDPELDLSDCPDLGPVLFTAAALLHGATFTGTQRLKIKESDRGACMQRELKKFGVPMKVEENRIRVEGGRLHAPTDVLDGHNDHRIVMALAVAAVKAGGTIEGAQAINKSFPDFFEKLKGLGPEVILDGMDQ